MSAGTSGGLQLQALGHRLKALGADGLGGRADLGAGFGGGRTLKAQLAAGIRAAAKPAVDAVREAARESLPSSGGLNAYVGSEKIATSVLQTGPRVGVRIRPASGRGWGANQASIRHPVFGHRNRKWPTTEVRTPGWFSETLEKQAPKVVAEISAVMDVIAAEVARREL